MRGTLHIVRRSSIFPGIIPAYAGNTGHSRLIVSHAWDHPRICGEHASETLASSAFKGSSPHMRGTLQRSPQRHVPAGIIPAYAGNTRTRASTLDSLRDHPRICGEHLITPKVSDTETGSSPHMRGTPRVGFRHPPGGGSSPHMRGTRPRCLPCTKSTGIIPAYAGNTVST